jgi:hypothetical protein
MGRTCQPITATKPKKHDILNRVVTRAELDAAVAWLVEQKDSGSSGGIRLFKIAERH